MRKVDGYNQLQRSMSAGNDIRLSLPARGVYYALKNGRIKFDDCPKEPFDELVKYGYISIVNGKLMFND